MSEIRPLVCPVLVGRDELLALADRRRTEARSSRGGLLFLAGEAGIGKTRLAGSIETRAATEGFTLARGAAFPADTEATCGLLLDLARDLQRTERLAQAGEAMEGRIGGADVAATPDTAAGHDEALSAGDPHRSRRILVLDLADVLAGLPAAAGGPVLLALEDLHWVDDLTLEVLAALARRLPGLPMLVLGTYRSDELYPRVPMREWRSRLLAGRFAEEARVARLDRDQTATMASVLLGTGLPASRDLVDAVHARSDGVPLHVEELLAVLRTEAGRGPLDAAGVGSVAVPDTLEDAILGHAGRLSPSARAAADAAAVIGRTFDLALLATVLDALPEELASDVAELELQFLVARSRGADRLDFRHALIRDALYEQLPAPVRRRLHGRVADATAADVEAGAAARSVHLEAAGRDGEAFEAALAGGRRAAALSAHREARELFERAHRTAPGDLDPARRAALLEALAGEAAATDDNEAADRWYAAATAAYEDAGLPVRAAGVTPRHVAVRHLLGDDLQARSARLEVALGRLDGHPPGSTADSVRAQLLAGLSAAHMLDRRLEAAIGYGQESRQLASAAGDERTELDVAATVGSCLVFAGRMEDGWAMLEDAVGRSSAARREAEAARAYRMLGSCASVLVEYERADRWLREGIEFAERVELWNHRHYLAAHLAHVLWATGSWVDAESLAGHALADGRGGITTRITALHVLGYVALGRGDLDRAEAVLHEARELGEGMAELQRLSPALWGLAEAARLRGDAAASVTWCRQGEEASRMVHDAAYLFPFLVTGARAHLLSGDPAGAEAWVDRVGAAVAKRSIPGTLPAIDHAAGLVLMARGTTGRARDHLRAAADGWTGRRRSWEGSWATLDLATALARSNRPADAARLAGTVLEQAAVLGSAPLRGEAEALRHRVRARSGDEVAWAPLTARELEVAQHIALGETNGQIAAELGVAPRTVAAHVEHILAKLGMTRRAEVAAWVVRVGGTDGAASG